MLDQAIGALGIVFDLSRFLTICFGVVLGLFIGVIPGIGGLVGMALLLPFTYAMDPYTALAFLIGMWAVTPTADTIPSVLFGVPGSAGSATTVLDGYPMARRGEAGRAIGASNAASVIGGLFGALVLGVSIPVLRPFMMSFGTPELLALCVLGLMLVAAISQGAILKGLIAASVGVIFAAVGDEPQTGELRWTFDTFYLWDGIPLVALVLGLFAIPEMIDVGASRKAIAMKASPSIVRDQFQGVKDAIKNWRIVLTSSWMGVVLGSVPGLGGPAIDWITYGTAARAVKDGHKTFGTGDVRGVIATEAATNSKEGGALVPTIAFGIPGSATMAILLGAFIMHGIQPGPSLLSDQLDVTYTIVWSLVVGNVVGVLLCFIFIAQLAKMTLIPPGILVPIVISIAFVGAYQATRDIGDLILLLCFCVLGWLMKRFAWPRAALLLGLVLGGLVEQYLFISVGRYGFTWLERPGVIIIFMIPVAYLIFRAVQFFRRTAAERTGSASEEADTVATPSASTEMSPVDRIAVPAMWALVSVFFAAVIWSSWSWGFAAKLMPQTVAWAGLLCVVFMGVATVMKQRAGVPTGAVKRNPASDPLAELPDSQVYPRVARVALWVFSIFVGTLAVGFLPALFLFMLGYMLIEGKTRPLTAVLVTAMITGFLFLLFQQALHVPWPNSYLGDFLPGLRRSLGGII